MIDNEHVSRNHAQIRKINGQFVIHDLNSTVGTSVNGEPVDQVILRSGDVISLGGVPVIFGQGSPIKELESLDLVEFEEGDSRPTDNNEIQSVDKYLDLFNTLDE